MRSILSIAAFLAAASLQAQTFTSGDFSFTVTDEASRKVELSGYIPDSDATEDTPQSAILEVPSTISYNSEEWTVAGIGASAFENYANITKVILPEEMDYIGNYAFADCTGLKEIKLPGILTTLGRESFRGCSELESIQLPKGIEVLPENLFRGCISLIHVTAASTLTSIEANSFYRCRNLEIVPDLSKAEFIGAGAFNGCCSLTTADISSMKSNEGYIFEGCTSLKKVLLGADMTEIPAGIFKDCVALTAIELPENVVKIGDYAFSNCSSLLKIEIPETVTEIGNEAFSDCRQLASVEFNEARTYIGSRAFMNCSSINNLDLKRVTMINEEGFANSTGLTLLIIGEEMQSIGSRAFSGCEKLEEIYAWNDHAPALTVSSFDADTERFATLYVKRDLELLYLQSSYWQDFRTIKPADSLPSVSVGNAGLFESESDIRTEGLTVKIHSERPLSYTICTLSGTLIASGEASGDVETELPYPGIYFVKAGNNVKKVIVK